MSRIKYIRPIMTTEEAAEYLRMSRQWLEIARYKGDGPPFIKLPRMVRYRKRDLDKWIEKRIRNSSTTVE